MTTSLQLRTSCRVTKDGVAVDPLMIYKHVDSRGDAGTKVKEGYAGTKIRRVCHAFLSEIIFEK